MLILATVSLPLRSAAISSSGGAIILHGPHHSAQKSTSTGPLALRTSFSNEASLTWVVLDAVVVLIPEVPILRFPGLPPSEERTFTRNLGMRLYCRQGEGFSHAH